MSSAEGGGGVVNFFFLSLAFLFFSRKGNGVHIRHFWAYIYIRARYLGSWLWFGYGNDLGMGMRMNGLKEFNRKAPILVGMSELVVFLDGGSFLC